VEKNALIASTWGLVLALFLRYGLEPTGWLFYELSHATGIDGLYWGYSIFRGGGYAFGLWPYQTLACVLAGVLLSVVVMAIKRRENT
jgi:hypothetical protein